jgi:2-amino-4-hydroxy-6-hydroxymethyldihydropteridine diphosphokinase
MHRALIGLGSNVGRRRQTLQQAVERLGGRPGVALVARSGWYATRAIGGPPGQRSFFNAAALVDTSLAPELLLAALQEIENALGRRRGERWGPRTVDLDLLLYGQEVIESPRLTVPHPRMAWRRFVLEPAAEIAGEMIHPRIDWSVGRLLEHLDTSANYVAVTGPAAAGKTALASALARQNGAILFGEESQPDAGNAFALDPSGNAWPAALEFHSRRSRLLAADAAVWSDRKRLVISDFWFDQSLAYAGVWLPGGQLEAFRLRWEHDRAHVARPRLIVWLDAPAEERSRRLGERGQPDERLVRDERLDQIRQTLLDRVSLPRQAPVLWLNDASPAAALREVQAAVEAMQ